MLANPELLELFSELEQLRGRLFPEVSHGEACSAICKRALSHPELEPSYPGMTILGDNFTRIKMNNFVANSLPHLNMGNYGLG